MKPLIKGINRKLNTLKSATLLLSMFFLYPLYAQEHPDFSKLVSEVKKLMVANHYSPSELQGEEYKSMLTAMNKLAKTAKSTDDFINEFNALWLYGPFSHVAINRTQGGADKLATYLDNMKVGENGATLSWDQNTAILTVNTMMGTDTIEQITQAYQQIAVNQAKALIIDLRKNGGGAFAIRPLISHLINSPLEAGYFITQQWSKVHSRLPNKTELEQLEPWEGWSIRAFWDDVENTPVIKVQFDPAKQITDIPVYILTSSKTASAAELAVEALQAIGRAQVIGEPTAGQMLSQKPFDLPDNLALFLPIADYYSMAAGRLEKNPIQPNVKVSADKAMEVAKQLIAQQN